MARLKKTAAVARTDRIDVIIAKLNEIDGVEFARDAWENQAPENYGVVELSGEARQLWGDGHLLDSIWTAYVTLYVTGDDDTWPETVQAKLEELEESGLFDLTYTITREYDYQIDKVRWRWTLLMTGGLTWTEPESAEEPAVDGGQDG